jgi:hypothetical protein
VPVDLRAEEHMLETGRPVVMSWLTQSSIAVETVLASLFKRFR